MRRADLINIVESVYDLERDAPSWIAGILERLEPWLGDGVGLFGFEYAVAKAGNLQARSFASRGCSTSMVNELPGSALELEPQFVRRILAVDCTKMSEIPGWSQSRAAQHARSAGVLDSWSIIGRNPGGHGFTAVINRRSGDASPAAPERDAMTRMAMHFAAAHRLRERLRKADAAERAEAVIAPGGQVCHAVGEARLREARDALQTSARAIDRARGELRRAAPERAIRLWTTLTGARWTLVDHFDRDGKRYILAQENESVVPTHDALSPRERQVLANAALGRSNKEIAYALGIGHSTVRVLLTRAGKKLGVPTRSALVQLFKALMESHQGSDSGGPP